MLKRIGLLLVSKWNQFRINRFIKLRRKNKPLQKALFWSFLSADKAFVILDQALYEALGSVGFLSSGVNTAQITLILLTMLDLSTDMPTVRESVIGTIEDLRQHNWGLVRNAAEAAKKKLAVAV